MILRPYEPAGIIKTQSPVLATLIIELSSYVAIESHEACTGPLLLALSPGARFILLVKAEPITHNNATSDARGQTTMAEKKIQTNSKVQEIHGI